MKNDRGEQREKRFVTVEKKKIVIGCSVMMSAQKVQIRESLLVIDNSHTYWVYLGVSWFLNCGSNSISGYFSVLGVLLFKVHI